MAAGNVQYIMICIIHGRESLLINFLIIKLCWSNEYLISKGQLAAILLQSKSESLLLRVNIHICSSCLNAHCHFWCKGNNVCVCLLMVLIHLLNLQYYESVRRDYLNIFMF